MLRWCLPYSHTTTHWILNNCMQNAYSDYSSAKCKSVRKPDPQLQESPVALTSTSKYFQILPGLLAALQCALRFCKSIHRCCWKQLQLWKCIQNATRLTITMVKLQSHWDHCTRLWESSRGSETSVQALQENWCHTLMPVVLSISQPKAIHSSYSSFFQLQGSLHHNMVCIISVSLYLHIRKYRDNGDGLGDTEVIFGRPCSR
jgi:hypothetical protein